MLESFTSTFMPPIPYFPSKAPDGSIISKDKYTMISNTPNLLSIRSMLKGVPTTSVPKLL